MIDISKDELVKLAVDRHGDFVCTDMIDDAMRADTIDEAIDILITDSIYWDGGFISDGFLKGVDIATDIVDDQH